MHKRAETMLQAESQSDAAQDTPRGYAQRLNTLLEINRAILGGQSMEATAQVALEHLRQLVPCTQTAAIIFDYQASEAIVITGDGITLDQVIPMQEIRALVETLERGEVCTVEDLQTLRQGSHSNKALLQPSAAEQIWPAEDARACFVAPFTSHGKLIGALGLCFDRPGAFAPQHVEIVCEVADHLAVVFHQTCLHEQTQRHAAELEQRVAELWQAETALLRQLEELTLLHSIVTAGAEAVSEETLIERATEVIGETLLPDHFGVLLLDHLAGVLRIQPSYRAGQEVKEMVVPTGQDIIGQVATHGQSRRVSDVTQEPAHRLISPSARSGLCVPLLAGKQVIGVVNVESIRPDAFSDSDERLLNTLAGQLATALEKVRLMNTLEQRVADRTRELEALYSVTAIASESLNLEAVLEQSLVQTLAAVECQAGAIQVLEGETLQIAVQHDIPPDIITLVNALPIEKSAWPGWVLKHGRPLVVPDMSSDPRTPPAAGQSAPLPYVGVPMRTRGKAVGVLSVIGTAGQQFSTEEVALLAAIADHVAVAVENARLRQQAEQAAIVGERERLARELHDSVTQSLYSLTLLAEAGQEFIKTGALERVEQHLAWIGETAQQALKEMRLLVYELRPPALEEEGLVGALHQRLEAVEGRAGVKTRLLTEELIELPPHVQEGLYRIAQEVLNNTLKHAAATTVTVHIRTESEGAAQRVYLEVVDDGVGFEPETAREAGGLGLIIMQERAAELGGSLTVLSAPGEGTRVSTSLPVAHQSHESAQVTGGVQ